jgi:hypothetical protein
MQQQTCKTRFVVCVQNTDSGDLVLRKLYQVLPDEAAAADDYLRIIDESGEDYLYPAQYFLPLDLAQDVQTALLAAA